MRTLKIDSLSSFQIYNSVLLNVVTMLYITSPGLTVLSLEVCAFWLCLHPFLPRPSPPLVTTNLFSKFISCFFVSLSWMPHIGELIQHLPVLCLVTQSCPTLCDPVDCSLQYLPVSVQRISPGIMPARSIHDVADGRISFFFIDWVIFHGIYFWDPSLLWTSAALCFIAD